MDNPTRYAVLKYNERDKTLRVSLLGDFNHKWQFDVKGGLSDEMRVKIEDWLYRGVVPNE
jgi:hypothetical protein